MTRIVIAGSFDTKREPLGLLIEEVRRLGHEPVTIDTSVFPNAGTYDYPAAEVATAGGAVHADLPDFGRAVAVHVMAEGAANIVKQLCADGSMGTFVCMGGSNAATVFSKVTDVIPLGIPKLLMSTVVSGNTRPMINATDAVMLYPIVDIEGHGVVVKAMALRLAAFAVAGLTSTKLDLAAGAANRVGLTMFGVTTPCVSRCRTLLDEEGYEPFVVHANGTGGIALERLIADGLVSAVLDVSTTELADELFGGMFAAGPERMTTAARMGIPQVISTGAMDMINFGPLDTVPDSFRARNLIIHNHLVTLARTTPVENRMMGRTMADRLGDCSAPTVIVVPMRGVSEQDKEGKPFYDLECMEAFLAGLKSHLSPTVRVIEADLHINDPEFADLLVEQLLAVRHVHEAALELSGKGE